MKFSGVVIISFFVLLFPVKTGLQMLGDREDEFFIKNQGKTIYSKCDSTSRGYLSPVYLSEERRFSLKDFYSDSPELEREIHTELSDWPEVLRCMLPRQRLHMSLLEKKA